jgi:hypothetical protein
MFLLCQRTDTLPEIRALVNTDHLIAISPVSGGIKSKLVLVNGESWEVNLPFTRAIALLRTEVEIVEPVARVERRRAPDDAEG